MYGTEEEVWGCLLIMPDCWGLRLPEVRPYLSPDRLWEESDVDRVRSEWLEAPRVFGPRRRAVNYRINKRTVEITCGIADFIFPRREVSWRETPWPCPNIRLWYHCFIQQRVKTVKMVLALTYPRVRYPYTKASSRPAFLYITKERRNKLKWERFTVLKEGGLTGEGRGGGGRTLSIPHPVKFFSLILLIPTQKSTIFLLDILFYPSIFSPNTLYSFTELLFLHLNIPYPEKNPNRSSRRLDMSTLDLCFTLCGYSMKSFLTMPEISFFTD